MTRREFRAKLATCRSCRRDRLTITLIAAAILLLAAARPAGLTITRGDRS